MSSLDTHGATFYKLLGELSEIPELLAKLHEEELDKLRNATVDEIENGRFHSSKSPRFQDLADVDIEVVSTGSANELIPMETAGRYPMPLPIATRVESTSMESEVDATPIVTPIATNGILGLRRFCAHQEKDITPTAANARFTTAVSLASDELKPISPAQTFSSHPRMSEIREVWIPTREKVKEVLEWFPQMGRHSTYKPIDFFRQNVRSLSSLIHQSRWRRLMCRFPFHPESLFKTMWDVFAMGLLVYDSVMGPLQFIVEIDEARFMDWVIAIFWTLDMLVTSCTRVYINGELVSKITKIVCEYAKMWLCFDACLVCLEWMFLFSESNSSDEASITGLRGLRALRFVRLLRLVKARKLIRKLQGTVNSVIYLLLFDIIKYLAFIVFCNHVIACVWYWIGQSSGDDGWVAQTQTDSKAVSYKYLISLHWSITQFHGTMEIPPYTTGERFYAVLIVLVGLVTSTLLVSSITQAMVELQVIHSERHRQNRMVKRYLSERNISRALSESVKKFMKYAERQDDSERQEEADIRAFAKLPLSMLMDLHEEARGQHLMSRLLFNDIYHEFPRVIRHICHEAISETSYSADHSVFSVGDVWNHAMIVEHGTMLYYAFVSVGQLEALQSVTVSDGNLDARSTASALASVIRVKERRWICEAALWLSWECCGSLVPQSYVNTLEINSEDLARTMRKHDKCFVMSCMYARKLARFVREAPSDIKDYHVDYYIDQEDWGFDSNSRNSSDKDVTRLSA